MKNILITICGRAGSKGFKNKNLKTFLRTPLVYYTAAIAEDFKKRLSEECETTICLNTGIKGCIPSFNPFHTPLKNAVMGFQYL